MMEEKKVLERLQRQCARMESCTFDVRRKAMKALEGDAEAADRIVASLVKVFTKVRCLNLWQGNHKEMVGSIRE